MLNVPELERRWLRYRRSQRQPYIIAGGIASIAVAGILYGYFSYGSEETPSGPQMAAKTVEIVQIEKHERKPTAAAEPQSILSPVVSASTVPQQQPAGLITPAQPTVPAATMPPIHEFESDVMEYYRHTTPDVSAHRPLRSSTLQTAPKTAALPTQNTVPAATPPSPSPSETEPIKPYASTVVVKESTGAVKTPKISPNQTALPSIIRPDIPEQNSADVRASSVSKEVSAVPEQQTAPEKMTIQHESDMRDLQDVIARFKKNKSPVLSLFIAKTYYRIGNYQEAYNYALITNEIDSSIEDSWLIFAESLYQLNQKEMAVKTLKTYIQESSSVKAKMVLDQMEKGTFK